MYILLYIIALAHCRKFEKKRTVLLTKQNFFASAHTHTHNSDYYRENVMLFGILPALLLLLLLCRCCRSLLSSSLLENASPVINSRDVRTNSDNDRSMFASQVNVLTLGYVVLCVCVCVCETASRAAKFVGPTDLRSRWPPCDGGGNDHAYYYHHIIIPIHPKCISK